MEELIFIQATFLEANSIKLQGTRKTIQKYLENGYYIKHNQCGFWLLVKPSAVIVTLRNSTGQHLFNVKKQVIEYYERKRMTAELFDKFNSDATSGKIKFYTIDGGNGNCLFIK